MESRQGTDDDVTMSGRMDGGDVATVLAFLLVVGAVLLVVT